MKYIFLIQLSLLIARPGLSQPRTIPNDSAKKRFEQVESDLKRLQQTNDSLNKELYYYRGKEDIIVNRLNQVEAHADTLFSNSITYFTFIFSVILGVAGLVSWKFVQNEIDKSSAQATSKLGEQKALLEQFRFENKRMQFLIYNIYLDILHESLNYNLQGLKLSRGAAISMDVLREASIAYDLAPEDEVEQILVKVTTALKKIEEGVSVGYSNIEKLKNQLEPTVKARSITQLVAWYKIINKKILSRSWKNTPPISSQARLRH